MASEILFIDCQILQTAAFDRGMGKYITSLLRALETNRIFSKHFDDIVLVLNKNLDCTEVRMKFIEECMPKASLLYVDLPSDTEIDTESKYEEAIDKISAVVDKYDSGNSRLTYLITSPFFVKYVAAFPRQEKVHKMTVVFDLIPYKIWYRQRIFPDDLYFRHFRILLEADRLLTISNDVADNLHQLMGIDRKKTTVIDGGPFELNTQTDKSDRPTSQEYIIYPSAPIFHKNNINAVKGFNGFNKKHDNQFWLVFTSTFDDKTKEELSKHSKHLIFTGNVSDETLAAYRNNASLLLFASLAEGLGMPILEAIFDDLPVACSSIPVHREISEDALYFFDPTSPRSIARGIEDALQREDWEKKYSHYRQIKKKYSWTRSASILCRELTEWKHRSATKPEVRLISSSPSNGNAEGRLAELLFGSLSTEYNLSWQNSATDKRNKIQCPSYLGLVQLERTTEPQAEIIIGGGSDTNPSTIKVDVSNRAFYKFRIRKGNVQIFAKKEKIFSGLGFRDWVFTTKDGKVDPIALIRNDLVSRLKETR